MCACDWVRLDYLLMSRMAPCMEASAMMCMKVWVNGVNDMYCKALWVVRRLEKRYISASPFTKSIIMFSLVYNHLKLRIVVFSLAWNEPFISTKGSGPLPQSLPCCSAMFLQTGRGEGRGISLVAICRLTGRYHEILHTGLQKRNAFTWEKKIAVFFWINEIIILEIPR